MAVAPVGANAPLLEKPTLPVTLLKRVPPAMVMLLVPTLGVTKIPPVAIPKLPCGLSV